MLPPGAMEAEMHTIPQTFAAAICVAALSAQVAPNPHRANWSPANAALSFELGNEVCGRDRHQTLRRDWQGNWWWGPCVGEK